MHAKLAMKTDWRRRGWLRLDLVLAELIWLHPATAALFRSSATGTAGEDGPEAVVPVPRAA